MHYLHWSNTRKDWLFFDRRKCSRLRNIEIKVSITVHLSSSILSIINNNDQVFNAITE